VKQMKYFKIWPEYSKNGGEYAKWVDDSHFLMREFRINVNRSLIDEWPKELEFPVSPKGEMCDVLFNPASLFYSQNVCDSFEPMFGGLIEWLPVRIQGAETYYLLHPLQSVDLGIDAKVKLNPFSKSYTWIDKYDFRSPESLPDCFMINQAEGSVAKSKGLCLMDVVVGERLRLKMSKYRGVDFAMIFEH
jgi:hypothetical protein